MDKNKSVLIIILIAIIIAIAGLIVLNLNTHNIEYETLQLSNTCAVSVPISNNSTFKEENGLKTYNDTNLQIISYNKNDLGAWENLGANIGLQGALNQNFKYNHTHQGKNILIHPEENKTILACVISNNTTGDVVFVASQNEEILYHVIDSVNFTINNNTNISENATAKTTNSVEKKDNQSSSSSTPSNDKEDYYNGLSRSDFTPGEQAAIDDARANGYDSPAAYYEATGKTAGQAYIDAHPEEYGPRI